MSSLLSAPGVLGFRAGLCVTTGLSRSTFYRDCRALVSKADPDLEILKKIRKIVLDMPGYGYRRVAAHLAREGTAVNRKKVLGLMRRDNLLCRRRRKFVTTTDSNHGLAVYPNLVPSICRRRTNQLWIADITYIRLPTGFIYLAAVLDVCSRKAIGWALGKSIDTQLTLAALQMALSARGAPLYHHSDRGVQYASSEYVALLCANSVQISMSRSGNPYDNANMESFMKTLKYEEVLINDYQTIEQAKENIDYFIGKVYNQIRLHSALGYLTPDEFDADN